MNKDDNKDIKEQKVENVFDELKDDSEVLEFEFNEDGEEDFKKTIKKLRADLKVCKIEKTEY